jgi:hypothetical protein
MDLMLAAVIAIFLSIALLYFCPVENLAPNKLYEPVKVRENALT